MDLETWLDEEFKLLGVEVKVRHLLPDKYVKGSANAGISVVTVAYVDDIDVVKITTLLTGIEIACYRDSPNGGKASEMRVHWIPWRSCVRNSQEQAHPQDHVKRQAAQGSSCGEVRMTGETTCLCVHCPICGAGVCAPVKESVECPKCGHKIPPSICCKVGGNMNNTEAIYTRPKTVRFDDETYRKIEIAAGMLNMTTSAYIRHLTENAVAKIQLDRVLDQEAS
jgi:hypothetical protein